MPTDVLRRRLRLVWMLTGLTMLLALGLYTIKAAEGGSAFVRWRPQVLLLFQGENIYDEMMYPNPPIMAICFYPLMVLPTLPGALLWFVLKVAMTGVALVLCLRMVRGPDQTVPAWVLGLIILLSLRPILGDLHHGNINILIMFLVVGCLYAWRQGYDVLAGLILALAISFKVTPALFWPYFLWKRSWRTSGATLLGLALFLVIIPSLILGPGFNGECLATWWHRIIRPYVSEGVASDQEVNQSMVGVLTRLLTEDPDAGGGRNDRLFDHLNLAAWDPDRVNFLVKTLSVGFVVVLAWLCRTRTDRRDDPRLLGEFSLVVLTMLFVSERSWKHHYVTVMLPYTYLVWRLGMYWSARTLRRVLGASLGVSALLMASTSSEIGGVLGGEDGHKIAQFYGMFFWAGVVIYGTTAWRVHVEGRWDRPLLLQPKSFLSPRLPSPHVTARSGRPPAGLLSEGAASPDPSQPPR